MTERRKSLDEVIHQGMEVLVRELGVSDAARFISQFTTGHGDYTVKREGLFGQKSMNEIMVEIRDGSTGNRTN
jgi:hypothetical protein